MVTTRTGVATNPDGSPIATDTAKTSTKRIPMTARQVAQATTSRFTGQATNRPGIITAENDYSQPGMISRLMPSPDGIPALGNPAALMVPTDFSSDTASLDTYITISAQLPHPFSGGITKNYTSHVTVPNSIATGGYEAGTEMKRYEDANHEAGAATRRYESPKQGEKKNRSSPLSEDKNGKFIRKHTKNKSSQILEDEDGKLPSSDNDDDTFIRERKISNMQQEVRTYIQKHIRDGFMKLRRKEMILRFMLDQNLGGTTVKYSRYITSNIEKYRLPKIQDNHSDSEDEGDVVEDLTDDEDPGEGTRTRPRKEDRYATKRDEVINKDTFLAKCTGVPRREKPTRSGRRGVVSENDHDSQITAKSKSTEGSRSRKTGKFINRTFEDKNNPWRSANSRKHPNNGTKGEQHGVVAEGRQHGVVVAKAEKMPRKLKLSILDVEYDENDDERRFYVEDLTDNDNPENGSCSRVSGRNLPLNPRQSPRAHFTTLEKFPSNPRKASQEIFAMGGNVGYTTANQCFWKRADHSKERDETININEISLCRKEHEVINHDIGPVRRAVCNEELSHVILIPEKHRTSHNEKHFEGPLDYDVNAVLRISLISESVGQLMFGRMTDVLFWHIIDENPVSMYMSIHNRIREELKVIADEVFAKMVFRLMIFRHFILGQFQHAEHRGVLSFCTAFRSVISYTDMQELRRTFRSFIIEHTSRHQPLIQELNIHLQAIRRIDTHYQPLFLNFIAPCDHRANEYDLRRLKTQMSKIRSRGHTSPSSLDHEDNDHDFPTELRNVDAYLDGDDWITDQFPQSNEHVIRRLNIPTSKNVSTSDCQGLEHQVFKIDDGNHDARNNDLIPNCSSREESVVQQTAVDESPQQIIRQPVIASQQPIADQRITRGESFTVTKPSTTDAPKFTNAPTVTSLTPTIVTKDLLRKSTPTISSSIEAITTENAAYGFPRSAAPGKSSVNHTLEGFDPRVPHNTTIALLCGHALKRTQIDPPGKCFESTHPELVVRLFDTTLALSVASMQTSESQQMLHSVTELSPTESSCRTLVVIMEYLLRHMTVQTFTKLGFPWQCIYHTSYFRPNIFAPMDGKIVFDRGKHSHKII
jgi:hypothetical protein